MNLTSLLPMVTGLSMIKKSFVMSLSGRLFVTGDQIQRKFTKFCETFISSGGKSSRGL